MVSLGQLWGGIGFSGAEQPERSVLGTASAGDSKTLFSLGGSVGAAAIPSDLPQSAKAAKTAEQVRALSVERYVSAWAKANEEFGVQKLVWESLVLTQKEKAPDIVQATAKLQALLDLQRRGNDPEALLGLGEIARRAGETGTVLSSSMLKAIKDVVKQDGLAQPRAKLAERLARAGAAEADARLGPTRKDLEDLVAACSLEDAKLERKIRQVLMLPPLKSELGDKAGPKASNGLGGFTPVAVTGSRTLSQIARGTPMEPVSVTGSRMSSSGRGEAAARRTSNRGQSVGAVAGPTESRRSAASVRPDSAAQKVRTLAAESPGKAWVKLQEEYNVQKKVWDSVAMTKLKPSDKSQFEAAINNVAGTMNEIFFAARNGEHEAALFALRKLTARLPKDSDGGDLLNPSTRFACQDVLDQHDLAPLRAELAERLDVSNVPATLPRTQEQKAELQATVVKCGLGDAGLERTVRQMLLLPVPAALGSPVKKTSSKGSAVGGAKRSSSMSAVSGAKPSRKESAPLAARASPPAPFLPAQAPTPSLLFGSALAAPAPMAAGPGFQPPPRIIESM